ncbi:hypothetical protein GCM10022631_11600 [Deinococcus rubellus]|uniref:Uncharacterized protein n=1 Tax=Deinococcus rubellus TaxID=1889240 RepID=A0ABY5YCL1_9DEIO|nr:hypothetical protein [Deinococcus rubellus]UWX62795.1 hypothetical protein N0D28_08410 [Deinococcus rubellus]
MKLTFLLFGPLLLFPAAVLTRPAACTLTLSPDQVRGVAYHVRLIVSPGCPASTVFRIRKSSTLNVKRKGAPYQPIKPLTGAWEIGKATNTVPAAELWTSLTWRWELYDAERYSNVTGELGAWRGIVLERAP